MKESQIHSAVIEHWQHFGLPGTLVATIPNAHAFGQPGLTKGLPDLLVIGGGKVRFIELKSKGGRPTPNQLHIAELCEHNNIDHAFTYGRDEPIDRLIEWGILKGGKA